VPAQTLSCGLYLLNLHCPECDAVQEIAIDLDTRLTVDSAGARLAAKLTGKPVAHLCAQLRLTPPAEPAPGLFAPET
jgi:hypothetical protein